ncbi:hypothetical protein Tco_0735942 [Tanacetum coccineum]
MDQTISVKFWVLDVEFTFTLKHFANILGIPWKGQCAYSEECSLDSLKNNRELEGTDISEITRKPSKTSKHGHENGRVYKGWKPKPEKVKSTDLLERAEAEKT